MRKLTKKKYILASNGDCDLKNENKVARGTFFLDFYFSIGGSVHAEILAMKKEESEKQKLAEESLQLQANPEPQELSNPQDNKISDAYTYYETVD